MHALFWLSLVGVCYSYLLYPLILMALPRTRRRRADPPQWPRLSLIVAVHNEQQRIAEKLRNTLALDYPRDCLEVIVASDASDDATDARVRQFADQGVRLVRAPTRRGKEHAQWLALQQAGGDILVFSDAATRLPPDSLRILVRNFADPTVGAVSSEDRFVTAEGQAAGEGAYVRYEMWLRRLESGANSLVGLSGSFFAARRALCAHWDLAAPSDLNTAINAARAGYVAVTDPQLLGFYEAIRDQRHEYQRKFRTVLRGITGLLRHPQVLDPRRFGLFAFQIWSHKIMRWLVPWFLLGLLASSAALAGDGPLPLAVLAGQGLLYGLFAAGTLSARLRRLALVRVPFFFVQVNLAIAHATLAYGAGRRMATWQPSAR